MGAARDLTELVRAIYLNRQTGAVEVSHSAGTESLFFRRGELFLDRDHEVAQRISPLLVSVEDGSRSAAIPELRTETEELARRLCRLHGVSVARQDDRGMVVEVIGPVPTVCFVQELAVFGSDESEMLALLGGVDVKQRSSNRTPALEQLPGLDPDMSRVLAGLENPVSPGDLLRGGDERLATLRGLVKLWAVGLVKSETRPARAGQRPETHDILSPKLLETFLGRIARQLDEEAVDLGRQEHRELLADLLGRLGGLNHYELLGIGLKASSDELFSAYSRLARLVHPNHAPVLGLVDKDAALRVLFERATEAYLTLSDPKRRASYNTMAGIHVDVHVDVEQRRQEKREIARHNYQRSASCLAEMDYSQAVELLKEAARLDPQPEYFARLGLAQGKNPNWRHHAVESYRRAVELKPEDGNIRFGLAHLLEEMGRGDEARDQYEKVLETLPGHVGAKDGLERFGGAAVAKPPGRKSRTANFRSLFGQKSASDDG